MALVRTLLFAVLLATQVAGADPRLLALADPEADVLIGIRVSELANSPWLETAFEQARGQGTPWLAALDGLGLNPFAEIDEILIAARAVPGGGAEVETEHALVLVKTRLTAKRIQSVLCSKGCKQSIVGGRRLYEGGNLKNSGWTELEPGLIALGPREQLVGVIERKAQPAAATAWAGGFGQREIWLAAKGPFEPPDPGQAPPMLAGAVDSLKSFSAGLNLGDDPDLGLELLANSPADADRVFGLLQGLLAMASAAPANGSGSTSPADWLKNLDLHVDGASVLASLHIPGEELRRQIERAAASQGGSGTAPAVPAGTAAANPGPRPSKGPIRIYGLGSEPVVVGEQNRR